jgi:hypothetical protein
VLAAKDLVIRHGFPAIDLVIHRAMCFQRIDPVSPRLIIDQPQTSSAKSIMLPDTNTSNHKTTRALEIAAALQKKAATRQLS